MELANGRRLWATICEIEPGLFQAIYSNTGSASGEEDLPIYVTGLSLMEAKRRFEKDVQAFGYDAITWIEVNVAALALPRPGDIDRERRRGSNSGPRQPIKRMRR